jgi:hypothetical protein
VKYRIALGSIVVALAGAALYATSRTVSIASAPTPAPAPTLAALPAPDARLEFPDLLEHSPKLAPSAKATSLSGKRITLVGYMAQMELAPKGAFYLTSRPVQCDEAGGGTADLPPDSVLVLAEALGDKTAPFVPGALELSGVFDVGNRVDAEGRVSGFRLTLDAPLGEQLAQLDAPLAPAHPH